VESYSKGRGSSVIYQQNRVQESPKFNKGTLMINVNSFNRIHLSSSKFIHQFFVINNHISSKVIDLGLNIVEGFNHNLTSLSLKIGFFPKLFYMFVFLIPI
jgi:hypothetical protein